MRGNQYTQDFRDSAVQLALNGEKSVLQISEDLGVNSKTLYNWIRVYKQKNNIPIAPRGYTTSISKKQNFTKENELNRLRKENRLLKQEREKFRRRASIEPIIGHVKSDHRLARNYLKGFIGDEINLLLVASVFNLKKWMNNFIWFIFAVKITLIIYALRQQKPQERQKYVQLFLQNLKLW